MEPLLLRQLKTVGTKAEPVGDTLRGRGYEVAGEAEGADSNGVVFVRVAWIDAPHLTW